MPACVRAGTGSNSVDRVYVHERGRAVERVNSAWSQTPGLQQNTFTRASPAANQPRRCGGARRRRVALWLCVALCGAVWRCVALCGSVWRRVRRTPPRRRYASPEGVWWSDVRGRISSLMGVQTAPRVVKRGRPGACNGAIGARLPLAWPARSTRPSIAAACAPLILDLRTASEAQMQSR